MGIWKTFDFFLGSENSECQKKNVSEQAKGENQQQTQPTKISPLDSNISGHISGTGMLSK